MTREIVRQPPPQEMSPLRLPTDLYQWTLGWGTPWAEHPIRKLYEKITEKEFAEMCVAVSAGDPLFSGNFRMALENFDTNDDGLIDFDEFRNLNDRYPMILHPAFRMQDKLQKYTLGEEEWVKVMENINYWQKIKEYTDKEGEAPPSSRWERFREKYLRRCFGHAPVDLEYIASQSKMEQAKRAAAEEARLKAGG